MPTIIGSKSGTRPHLELDWSVNSQDIAGNRSSVKLKLYLRVLYDIGYNARYTGTLQGASFTASAGYLSKPGRYLLKERDVWISHNSDGKKTARLTADYNLNITWSRVYHGKISLSGDANLGTIPRASTMSAFSFGGHLKNGVANSIKYTVDRKNGGFRHQIQLRDGGTTIWTWDNQNTDGSNSITLTASNVNTLLNRMKTSTTKSFTLRIATRSGNNGGWIGSAVSRNATATVHADVKPSVGAVSLSQTGNSVSSHYLQGKSKVKASFSRWAGYGASISSSSIQVRRVSGGADSQTISSNDGTTKNPVSLNGSYQARGTATDSRGRVTNTAWATFTVTAYSAPRITNFTAVRDSDAETTIDVYRSGTHTSLGRANSARMLIQKRTGTGAWTTVEDISDASGAWGKTVNDTGNSVSSSYDFRATLTDDFGESATASVTVSTQRVVLDIHKNEGVGIGKIHEQGVLDIDGDVYSNGVLYTVGGLGSIEVPRNADLNNYTSNGFYHNRLNKDVSTILNTPEDTSFSLLVQRHAGIQQTFTTYGGANGTGWAQYIRHFYSGSWGPWERADKVRTGASGTIRWWRFGGTAGLQICTGSFSHNFGTTITKYVDLPASFQNTNYYVAMSADGSVWEAIETSSAVGAGPSTASRLRFQRYNSDTHKRVNGTYNYRFIAIGRWN